MPRGKLTKEELGVRVLKLKRDLDRDPINYGTDPKWTAQMYLNKVLDILEEYRE